MSSDDIAEFFESALAFDSAYGSDEEEAEEEDETRDEASAAAVCVLEAEAEAEVALADGRERDDASEGIYWGACWRVGILPPLVTLPVLVRGCILS